MQPQYFRDKYNDSVNIFLLKPEFAEMVGDFNTVNGQVSSNQFLIEDLARRRIKLSEEPDRLITTQEIIDRGVFDLEVKSEDFEDAILFRDAFYPITRWYLFPKHYFLILKDEDYKIIPQYFSIEKDSPHRELMDYMQLRINREIREKLLLKIYENRLVPVIIDYYGEENVDIMDDSLVKARIGRFGNSSNKKYLVFIVRYGDTEITDGKATHPLLGVYLRIILIIDAHSKKWKFEAIHGFRETRTEEEYVSHYTHSHFLSERGGFSNFCTGNSPILAYSLGSKFSSPLWKEEVEDMLLHADHLVQYQDNSNPYRRISNIKPLNVGSKITRSRPIRTSAVQWIRITAVKYSYIKVLPYRYKDFLGVKVEITNSRDLLNSFMREWGSFSEVPGLFSIITDDGYERSLPVNINVRNFLEGNFNSNVKVGEVVARTTTEIKFKGETLEEKIIKTETPLKISQLTFSSLYLKLAEKTLTEQANKKLLNHYEQEHKETKERTEEKIHFEGKIPKREFRFDTTPVDFATYIRSSISTET